MLRVKFCPFQHAMLSSSLAIQWHGHGAGVATADWRCLIDREGHVDSSCAFKGHDQHTPCDFAVQQHFALAQQLVNHQRRAVGAWIARVERGLAVRELHMERDHRAAVNDLASSCSARYLGRRSHGVTARAVAC